MDWNAPKEGWVSTYTVKVVPRMMPKEDEDEDADGLNRTRREEVLENVTEVQLAESRPPINITDLVPESKYDFIITTSLGPDWKSSVTVEDVVTTANSSRLPEGIVGVTMVPGEYQAAQFSILVIAMTIIAVAVIIFILSGTM